MLFPSFFVVILKYQSTKITKEEKMKSFKVSIDMLMIEMNWQTDSKAVMHLSVIMSFVLRTLIAGGLIYWILNCIFDNYGIEKISYANSCGIYGLFMIFIDCCKFQLKR